MAAGKKHAVVICRPPLNAVTRGIILHWGLDSGIFGRANSGAETRGKMKQGPSVAEDHG